MNDPAYSGRFSDGRTAASHAVTIEFGPARPELIIRRSDDGQILRWPLAALKTAEEITSTSVDVMIHEPGCAGATLFVAGRVFARDLATRAPHLKASARRWHGARPFLWVVAITAATAALIYVTDFSPARSLARLLPRDTRVSLGHQVVKSMTGGHRVCDAPAGKAALATLAKRLSEASGSKTSFDVSVVESDAINAFAAPGEQIVIMSKLIEKADSADEVAGVLAHEMGHGIELHPEAGIIRSVGLMAITEFMLGGSGGSIANVGLYLAQLGYSRQAERQADQQGLRILRNAGIAPRGIIDFFHRMSKGDRGDKPEKPGASDDAFAMLRTHPSAAERLAMMQAQPQYPATPALTEGEWKGLKSICGPAGAAPPPTPKKPAKPRDI